jgi:hypothetical protein
VIISSYGTDFAFSPSIHPPEIVMLLRRLNKMIVGLSFLMCSSVFAAPLVVNVAGIQSYGDLGDSGNTVLTFDVGAFATIIGVSYNVTITAFTPSFLSEISLLFSDSAQSAGFSFQPGFADVQPGTGTYAGSGNLIDLNLAFQVGADGLLRLEFFEDPNDESVSPDGIWNSGTITITTDADDPGTDVPEPATGMLMGAGLALMGYTARRRRNAAKAA